MPGPTPGPLNEEQEAAAMHLSSTELVVLLSFVSKHLPLKTATGHNRDLRNLPLEELVTISLREILMAQGIIIEYPPEPSEDGGDSFSEDSAYNSDPNETEKPEAAEAARESANGSALSKKAADAKKAPKKDGKKKGGKKK